MTARFYEDWRKRDILKELRERGASTAGVETLGVNELRSKYLECAGKRGRGTLYEVNSDAKIGDVQGTPAVVEFSYWNRHFEHERRRLIKKSGYIRGKWFYFKGGKKLLSGKRVNVLAKGERECLVFGVL